MRAWSDQITVAGGVAEFEAVVAQLEINAPRSLDLTNTGADTPLTDAADLLATSGTHKQLLDLDADLAAADVSLSLRLTTKLALSKQAILALSGPGFVSVIFAVYQEHDRILTSSEHPHGEDFLRRKLAQLEWLFNERPDVGWEIIVVDDGCPNGSGQIAQKILDSNRLGANARVLYLDQAIANSLSVAGGLTSTADSRKGGSILYGMWEAVQTTHDGHVVIFTDADLSTHLGQCGLLLERLVDGVGCAAASRREPTSAVVKAGGRNDRGKLFIYLWKQMLAPLSDLVDTQCGFKAFTDSTVSKIVLDNDEKQFAFDIELLLRTELANPGGIARVPVAWIDSEAASTTTDLQPYLPMLKSISEMYRRYLPQNVTPNGFASFIDRLDQDGWERLLTAIPVGITSREPTEFSTFHGVSPSELAAAANTSPF